MATLTKTDWLDHGLRSLSDHGFTTLKADILAKSLGVSRGSFYHHFGGLSDFHAQVLDRWVEVSSMTMVAELEVAEVEPKEKVRLMINLAATRASRLEQAIRAWAFTDSTVAATVAEIDRARLAYIETILADLDIDADTAKRQANVLYLTNVGYSFLSETLDAAELEQVITDLVDFAGP